MGASVQRCPYSVCPNHPAESEGTPPGIVGSPLGTRSVMVERFFCRCQDDQRKIGNGGHEARIPRCVEIPQVPDSGGRVSTSGRRVEAPNNRTVSKFEKGSCSRLPEYGTGGKDQVEKR